MNSWNESHTIILKKVFFGQFHSFSSTIKKTGIFLSSYVASNTFLGFSKFRDTLLSTFSEQNVSI